MGLISTLAFAVSVATLRIYLERIGVDMQNFSLGLIGTLVVVGWAWYEWKRRDAGTESEDPTPGSGPATTLSAPASVEQWINEATRASNVTGVNRNLILAVIWQESGGNPDAVGSAGEQGLMQVTEIAAEDVGETLPTTDAPPQRQITVGTKYLEKCAEYVGEGASTYEQLRCYNEGPPPLTADASKTYASQVLDKMEALTS